jgi:cell shape-determining protein MreC
MPVSTFTSLDILYLILSASILILAIFLSVVLVNLTLVLRDFRKMSRTAGDITEKVHSMVLTPVSYISRIADAVSPQVEEYIKNKMSKKKKK